MVVYVLVVFVEFVDFVVGNWDEWVCLLSKMDGVGCVFVYYCGFDGVCCVDVDCEWVVVLYEYCV